MSQSIDNMTAAVARLETQSTANTAELKDIAAKLTAANANNDSVAIDALTVRINAVADSMAAADAAAAQPAADPAPASDPAPTDPAPATDASADQPADPAPADPAPTDPAAPAADPTAA